MTCNAVSVFKLVQAQHFSFFLDMNIMKYSCLLREYLGFYTTLSWHKVHLALWI